IAAFDAARNGQTPAPDSSAWASEGLVNGYWFGDAGIAQHPPAAAAMKGVCS
ncbi:MAG: U32 family peptidase, partial [Candidatus Accumulibacter phosphatis]|nr:U32 family peptidase [Candidatus Accumulibacter phosphatis]